MLGKNPYRELEKNLGYRFRRRKQLEAALTHRSHRFEQPGIDSDNQRLEFLGDAALNLVVGEYLYREFTDLDEGALTQLRSRVTSAAALSVLGRAVGIGEHLRLGRGERMSGGAERESNLEDALEAIVGAAYVERGLPAVEKIFRRLFVPMLDDVLAATHSGNPKGDLQEHCQRLWKESPRYVVTAETGPGHARRYVVEVRVGERVLGSAEGANKRTAEAAAAAAAMAALRP